MTAEATQRDTVRQILQAATELFSEKNFEAVSTKSIAERASVNSALISYYFGGKKQLYAAVLQQQVAVFGDCIKRLRKENLTGLQRIWHLMDDQATIHMQDNSSMRIIYRELLAPTKASQEQFGSELFLFYDHVAALFDEAKAEGSVRSDVDSYTASFTLFSILVFFLLTYRYNPQQSRLPGDDTRSRIRGALRSYLKTLLTGKEELP